MSEISTVGDLIEVLSKMDPSKQLRFPLEVDGEDQGEVFLSDVKQVDDCVEISVHGG